MPFALSLVNLVVTDIAGRAALERGSLLRCVTNSFAKADSKLFLCCRPYL
jgi:hypothetical protein